MSYSISNKYKSCSWLHDHFQLGPDGEVHACCYWYSKTSSDVRGSIELCRITGNRFPAEEIVEARRLIHQQIEDGTHHDCCECPNLTTDQWTPREYLASGLSIDVWTQCNLKCRYCFTTNPGFVHRKVKYDSVALVADMLAGKHLDPAGSVTWGGGDVGALPEFEELALMFLSYGVFQAIKTSAFKFLPAAAAVIAQNRGTIEVSVDAGTRETYADFKGRDAFDEVVENLGRYRAHGPIRLKYIASPCNLGDRDIDGFIGLVKKLRPVQVMVTPEHSALWGSQYDEPLIRQIAKLINLLIRTGVHVIPWNHDGIARLFRDLAPGLELALEHHRILPRSLRVLLGRMVPAH